MQRRQNLFHFFILDSSDEEDNVHRRPNRRQTVFERARINYNTNRNQFREAFRIDMEVVDQLERYLSRHIIQSARNNSLSPREQILTTLHFLGNGAQYHVNGHMHGISKSTVCRCVHRVCGLIAKYLLPIYVRWPSSSILVEREFFEKAGFPHVRGIIDGTLIHIDAPSEEEPIFVSRDNKHAINVLVVSGPRNQFFFASAKSPGSFHDSRALRISKLWQQWEVNGWRPDGDQRSIILGDSAYPLRPWLMPPIIRDVNANIRVLAQTVSTFLRAHRRTRFIVECSIGILKEQFPCLNHFRYKTPAKVCTSIYACVTLHNMQNYFRNGSYLYDTVLSRLVNQNFNQVRHVNEPNHNNQIENDDSGILRQREILEFFARQM